MTNGPHVVVIGGGATGCSVARDLAMRDLDVTLVERGSINAGTSGRSHGLLHSGARYADTDPTGARECAAESRILARIGGHCVDQTGGFFVQLDGDDSDYFDRKLEACENCDIPVEVLDGSTAREREPTLAPSIKQALAVPDAVVSPSRLVAATAASARNHGVRLLTGTEVVDISRSRGVVEAIETDHDGAGRIQADHFVNAAGAWAGRVAALGAVQVGMKPTSGVMVAVDLSRVGTILNRCRPPTDGDIMVPRGSQLVCGTTSTPIEDPNHYPRHDTEVHHILSECAAMVPAVEDAPVLRRYWGVRPLPESLENADAGDRQSRSFLVFDHADRDGLRGFTTVVGGKLTTCRLMAEVVADQVSDALGHETSSRTDVEPLPGHDDPARLDAQVETFNAGGPADANVT